MAQLKSGTTIAGSTAWHAGNDGPGSGLDADKLDGLDLHTGRNNVPNRVVRTQGNGYAEFGWINTTSGNTTGTITDFYVNTNDGYIRKATKAHVLSQLGLNTNSIEYFQQTSAPANKPDGTMWLDTADEVLYQKQSGSWIQVSTGMTPVIDGSVIEW